MTKRITAIIAGAGSRGSTYARYAQLHPDELKIVGVAEPLADRRQRMVETFAIPSENIFEDWKAMAEKPRFADAVIIATQDAMHADPAVTFASKKYAMLLEKPLAPTEAESRRIIEAVQSNGIIFAVCHVLRYTAYTQTLKELLDRGEIGEIVSIQHLEPVGFWHQAHSFVRGNWRNAAESSFMLLAKSCHDLDWLSYIVGDKCRSVSSFGSLKHFKRSEKPKEAGSVLRCIDCSFEPKCAYSAQRIYYGFYERGFRGWPLNVLTTDPTLETIGEALKTGPYGRCVYECDNDVVDHQVVSLQFTGDQTAVFTMTAFNQAAERKTRIFGTHGEIYGDGSNIEVYNFLSASSHTVQIDKGAGENDQYASMGGHGGGDYNLMRRFVQAVRENNQDIILSGPIQSLESHNMVFAAEKARIKHMLIDLE